MNGASGPVLADPQSAARWADLRLRFVTAAILGPLVLLAAWLGGWLLAFLLLVGFAGSVWEWGVMCRLRPAPFVVGVVYAGGAMAALWLIRRSFGAQGIFFILLVVWCSDIGAYVVGRLVGGPRLAPSISPGKTWSGAAGGLVAAIVGGMIIAGLNLRAGGLAALFGIASQLGDLGESALKRHYKVKDSGRLIPGHGGMLDRLDGLMAASVAAWLVLGLSLATGPFAP